MRTRLTGDFLIEQQLEKMKERNPDHKDAFEHMLSLIFWNTTQIEITYPEPWALIWKFVNFLQT